MSVRGAPGAEVGEREPGEAVGLLDAELVEDEELLDVEYDEVDVEEDEELELETPRNIRS